STEEKKKLWRPPCHEIPHWVDTCLARFSKAIEAIFRRRRAPSNLLPFQKHIFENLIQDHSIVYELLSEAEAMAAVKQLKTEIDEWLDKYELDLEESDHSYISTHPLNNKDPFGYFYLLYKIHKLPSLDEVDICPTRPVCSSCGSVDHPLGAWVNLQIQPVAQAQPSFIKNSASLLKELSELNLPPNVVLFTADAKSMYTNIDTDVALDIIPKFLEENESQFGYNTEALIAALEIVFRNNLFRFGDLYTKQISGTAMGKRPAPPWATIFFAIHENGFVPLWIQFLLFFKRYLDDILSIWLAHPDPETNAKR
ncbi:hypothetical protein ACHAXR_003988, partial [Thalassiosira sp. AJA248-18]